jgi:shikimate kinase
VDSSIRTELLLNQDTMRIFLTGVSCIGKTTIGAELASLLGFSFFDFDNEVELFFGKPIARLQSQFLTMYSYRKEAAKALEHLLIRTNNTSCVIALPPSGLMDNYWRILKKANRIVVVLTNAPENILKRSVFYDDDSNPIQKTVTASERSLYLKEIKKDIAYFRRTYERADIAVDISDLGVTESAARIKEALKPIMGR